MTNSQKILNSYNYSLKLREQFTNSNPNPNMNSPLKPSLLTQISPKKTSKSCSHSRQATLSEFDVAYQGSILTSGNCSQIFEVAKEQKSKYYTEVINNIFPESPIETYSATLKGRLSPKSKTNFQKNNIFK